MKSTKPKHIGIVGCSSEGAALCYRTICLEGGALMGEEYAHPEVSMHTNSLGEYINTPIEENWDSIANLMIDSGEKLAKAGAEFIICPDNTIHQVFDQVAEKTSLPWLNIAEEVAKEAAKKKYKKLALFGTKYLMEGQVYPPKLKTHGISCEIPEKEDRENIDSFIFKELVRSIFKEKTRRYFSDVIDKLKSRGCDAAILGCTEIPLLISERDSGLPILDSTRLLARAALKYSIGDI